MLYAVIKPPVPPSSGCQLQMAAPLIVSAHLLALKFPRRESFLLSSLPILSPRWARGVRTETAISTLRPRYNPYESHWLNCDQSRRDTDVLSAAFMTFWVTHELEKARIWTQIWQKKHPHPPKYIYIHTYTCKHTCKHICLHVYGQLAGLSTLYLSGYISFPLYHIHTSLACFSHLSPSHQSYGDPGNPTRKEDSRTYVLRELRHPLQAVTAAKIFYGSNMSSRHVGRYRRPPHPNLSLASYLKAGGAVWVCVLCVLSWCTGSFNDCYQRRAAVCSLCRLFNKHMLIWITSSILYLYYILLWGIGCVPTGIKTILFIC